MGMVMICVEGRNLCVTLEGSGRSVGCCKAGKCCKGGDFKDGGENQNIPLNCGETFG